MKTESPPLVRTSRPTPDVLLFDLDGVLADVRDSYRMCVLETARFFGADVDATTISRAKNRPDANNDWIVTQRIIRDHSTRYVPLSDIIHLFQEFYAGTDERPGLRENERLLISDSTLESLSSRFRLGIVTGRPGEECRWFLDRFDLTSFFEAIVCMEDAATKPAPDGILRAMTRLGGTTAFMFGDSVDDMVAANTASTESEFDIFAVGIPAPESSPDTRSRLLAAGADVVLGQSDHLTDLLP